ncbi:MAG: hypothetical protein KGQ41_09085 [Alphaproteobacteria bacterium]|nr:hypothetical protein [Alphaproteobacteria bacterium]
MALDDTTSKPCFNGARLPAAYGYSGAVVNQPVLPPKAEEKPIIVHAAASGGGASGVVNQPPVFVNKPA